MIGQCSVSVLVKSFSQSVFIRISGPNYFTSVIFSGTFKAFCCMVFLSYYKNNTSISLSNKNFPGEIGARFSPRVLNNAVTS